MIDKHLRYNQISKILQEGIDYIDNPAFHKPNPHFFLFKESIDMTEAELSWHDTMFSVTDDPIEFKKPSKKHLLTGKQEVVIFSQYNYARKIVKNLINKSKLRNKEHIRLIKYYNLYKKLENDILIANLGLVVSRASAFNIMQNPNYADILQEARVALMRAIKKFDVSKGWKFSTYCCRAIHTQLYRELHQKKKTRVTCLESDLVDNCFETYTYREDKAFSESIAVRESVVDLNHVLHNNLADLNPVEKKVLNFRFELPPENKFMTLEAIGKMIGLTKERTRQIEVKALQKIRETMNNRFSGELEKIEAA